jgi:hypothetical protein
MAIFERDTVGKALFFRQQLCSLDKGNQTATTDAQNTVLLIEKERMHVLHLSQSSFSFRQLLRIQSYYFSHNQNALASDLWKHVSALRQHCRKVGFAKKYLSSELIKHAGFRYREAGA